VTSGDALERLRALAPPPDEPVETGGEAPDWKAVEAELGTPLPDDYKALTQVYGSGKFDDFLWLFSPFAPEGPGNLLDERVNTLDAYTESRTKHPERYPLPPFPEPGGVLPLGRSDNGDELYWVTGGEPAAWTVALLGSRSTPFEQHPLGVTAFLAALLGGELETKVLPHDVLHRTEHEFVPFS
jgi:SMI1/KNR4 family protein SUKH-1